MLWSPTIWSASATVLFPLLVNHTLVPKADGPTPIPAGELSVPDWDKPQHDPFGFLESRSPSVSAK